MKITKADVGRRVKLRNGEFDKIVAFAKAAEGGQPVELGGGTYHCGDGGFHYPEGFTRSKCDNHPFDIIAFADKPKCKRAKKAPKKPMFDKRWILTEDVPTRAEVEEMIAKALGQNAINPNNYDQKPTPLYAQPPQRQEVVVNIYRSCVDGKLYCNGSYPSARGASIGANKDCVGRMKITLEEGRWDE